MCTDFFKVLSPRFQPCQSQSQINRITGFSLLEAAAAEAGKAAAPLEQPPALWSRPPRGSELLLRGSPAGASASVPAGGGGGVVIGRGIPQSLRLLSQISSRRTPLQRGLGARETHVSPKTAPFSVDKTDGAAEPLSL